MEKEIRSFQGVASPTISGRTVTGYAIVFNSPSEILVQGGRRFREIILPSAIDEDILKSSDIRMLLEHNPERLLARSNKGQGTLKYKITPRGVMYEFTAPNTSDGDYAVELLRRGDLTGSSFAFYAASDRWEDKNEKRIITKIGRLYDFSIVSTPAYSETTSQVRARFPGSDDWKASLAARAKKAGLQSNSRDERMKSNYIKAGLPIPSKYK